MKKIMKNIFIAILFCAAVNGFSQSLNWTTLNADQHDIATAYIGLDYAMVYGASYGRQLPTRMPILLNVDFSAPAGAKALDDFKTKVGGQARLYRLNDFHFSASFHGIYRRYENPLVRLQNFGAELKGVVGYYKPKWFAAGEFGFDKAVVTHFKHSDSFKEDFFAEVKDGWYAPSTGGNFNFGFQVGYSFQRSDVVLKMGRVITQDLKMDPTFPFYAALGYNLKF